MTKERSLDISSTDVIFSQIFFDLHLVKFADMELTDTKGVHIYIYIYRERERERETYAYTHIIYTKTHVYMVRVYITI
jgi:hypothetical protein